MWGKNLNTDFTLSVPPGHFTTSMVVLTILILMAVFVNMPKGTLPSIIHTLTEMMQKKFLRSTLVCRLMLDEIGLWTFTMPERYKYIWISTSTFSDECEREAKACINHNDIFGIYYWKAQKSAFGKLRNAVRHAAMREVRIIGKIKTMSSSGNADQETCEKIITLLEEERK